MLNPMYASNGYAAGVAGSWAVYASDLGSFVEVNTGDADMPAVCHPVSIDHYTLSS